ncbi:hypothetical protein F5I97DRAFT_926511 [Phlebopus sp. FC_14]|nr:hypothetical protein F5I97DRAFT_926511 [Phlebopus sp. FC_14]
MRLALVQFATGAALFRTPTVYFDTTIGHFISERIFAGSIHAFGGRKQIAFRRSAWNPGLRRSPLILSWSQTPSCCATLGLASKPDLHHENICAADAARKTTQARKIGQRLLRSSFSDARSHSTYFRRRHQPLQGVHTYSANKPAYRPSDVVLDLFTSKESEEANLPSTVICIQSDHAGSDARY